MCGFIEAHHVSGLHVSRLAIKISNGRPVSLHQSLRHIGRSVEHSDDNQAASTQLSSPLLDGRGIIFRMSLT